MIPKQLFFIWLGDNKPDYVDFSINAYKKANPDFKINLIRYTTKQIENRENISKYDHNIYNCLDYILSDDPSKYKNLINSYKEYKRKTIQILANILRLDLLNEYGGIYLDCDTFPLKPFDDFILEYESFYSSTFLSFDDIHRRKDCCFIGNSGIRKYNSFYLFNNSVCINKYKFQKDDFWINKRKLFFNCLLDYKEYDTEYYIEHYCDRTWTDIRTPLCKYDS